MISKLKLIHHWCKYTDENNNKFDKNYKTWITSHSSVLHDVIRIEKTSAEMAAANDNDIHWEKCNLLIVNLILLKLK